jgi:hypothetical protein
MEHARIHPRQLQASPQKKSYRPTAVRSDTRWPPAAAAYALAMCQNYARWLCKSAAAAGGGGCDRRASGHGKLLLNLWLHDIVLLSGQVLLYLNLKHGELLIL